MWENKILKIFLIKTNIVRYYNTFFFKFYEIEKYYKINVMIRYINTNIDMSN